ncbi:hypothetical protein ACQYRI_03025 [Salmonella enterica]
MQEIQAIQASTQLAPIDENTPAKADVASSSDSNTESKSFQDDSIKVTLSSRAEGHKEIEDIKAEQYVEEKKTVESHEIDYSLAMTGIPQYGGKLVTIVKYPDGRTEMVDAFSGEKVTAQDIAIAQQRLDAQLASEEDSTPLPGESVPTDRE